MSTGQRTDIASLFDGRPAPEAFAVSVSDRKQVRVYVADHQGTAQVHVREFKHDWRTGKMSPSHSGATVPVERLGELIEALQQLQARGPGLANNSPKSQ